MKGRKASQLSFFNLGFAGVGNDATLRCLQTFPSSSSEVKISGCWRIYQQNVDLERARILPEGLNEQGGKMEEKTVLRSSRTRFNHPPSSFSRTLSLQNESATFHLSTQRPQTYRCPGLSSASVLRMKEAWRATRDLASPPAFALLKVALLVVPGLFSNFYISFEQQDKALVRHEQIKLETPSSAEAFDQIERSPSSQLSTPPHFQLFSNTKWRLSFST